MLCPRTLHVVRIRSERAGRSRLKEAGSAGCTERGRVGLSGEGGLGADGEGLVGEVVGVGVGCEGGVWLAGICGCDVSMGL